MQLNLPMHSLNAASDVQIVQHRCSVDFLEIFSEVQPHETQHCARYCGACVTFTSEIFGSLVACNMYSRTYVTEFGKSFAERRKRSDKYTAAMQCGL